MKVKCIGNKGYEKWITISKIYDVMKYTENKYKIIDDHNNLWFYNKRHFKTLSKYRNDKIDKLLR